MLKKGITGIIDPYEYSVNTDLESKNKYLYAPTKYNLKNNATNNPKLKDASLYSDRALLKEFLKKHKTILTNDNNIKNNAEFILKLLFKKNSKFYIKKLEFIVDKDLEDKDISFDSENDTKKSQTVLDNEALATKRKEIRDRSEKYEEYMKPSKDASNEIKKRYKKMIEKQRNADDEEFRKFYNNQKDREKYLQEYKNKYYNKFNKFTISLVLKPSKQTAQDLNIIGFNITPEYLPISRDCKLQKKQIYHNFLDLLCKPVENRLAKYKPGIIPAFDPTKKGTRKNTIKPSKNSLAKYKPKSIPGI